VKIYTIRPGARDNVNADLIRVGRERAYKAGAILQKLGLGEETPLFSSPKQGALQTAEVVKEVCGFQGIAIVGWLDAVYLGDFLKEMFPLLKGMESPAAIFVGHSPHFEALLQAYFSDEISVEDGDVYEIDLDDRTAMKLS